MRTRVSLTAEGDSFRVRFTELQAHAITEALGHLSDRDFPEAAFMAQLGAGRNELGELAGKLTGDPGSAHEASLSLTELHVIHAALSTTAQMFLVQGTHFSEEAFHRRLGFYRENFDGLAMAIVQAVAAAESGG